MKAIRFRLISFALSANTAQMTLKKYKYLTIEKAAISHRCLDTPNENRDEEHAPHPCFRS
jgi:hypothetical protein